MSRAMRIIEKIDVFFQSPPSPETFCITARKFWVSRGRGISFNRGEEECLLICIRAQFS